MAIQKLVTSLKINTFKEHFFFNVGNGFETAYVFYNSSEEQYNFLYDTHRFGGY